MSAPSSSHALACRRIWYRLDQIMLAGFFGKTEIPLAGNKNPSRCKLSAIFPCGSPCLYPPSRYDVWCPKPLPSSYRDYRALQSATRDRVGSHGSKKVRPERLMACRNESIGVCFGVGVIIVRR